MGDDIMLTFLKTQICEFERNEMSNKFPSQLVVTDACVARESAPVRENVMMNLV